MPDFLPKRDADLQTWARNFSGKIAADPEAYGISAAQSAALLEAFDAFVTLLGQSMDNSARTPRVILLKKEAAAQLKAQIRTLAGIVRANPAVTIDQRVSLGLRPRAGATRIKPPESKPVLSILSVDGRRVTIRLMDSALTSRGKPQGVVGAMVYSYVGESEPTENSDWTIHAQTSRTKLTLTFPAEIPGGSMVWITAKWLNPRMQGGPCALAKSTWLAGGTPMPGVSHLVAA